MMTNKANQAVESLKALGFTALEADVYAALAATPSMTGYRIAQLLNKPAANVYKAIESLQAKGSVLVDNSGSRFYRAVPPGELLASLGRAFQERIQNAETALSQIQTADADERTYELLTRDQVYERARAMLQECREVALLDLFPEPLALLGEEIRACAKRGIIVTILAYGPASMEPAQVLQHHDPARVRKRWPGQWLNLVVDARQHMLSFLSADGSSVLQAIWSASPYLSWIYHCGLTGEMMTTEFTRAVRNKAGAGEMRAIVKRFEGINALEAPGYRALVRKFGLEKSKVAGRKAI